MITLSATSTNPGYDAVKSGQRRTPPKQRVRSEDNVLRMPDRQRMSESTSDLYRNFSVAAWAIRRHLDYVTRFAFDCHTGDESLDKAIEDRIAERMRPQNCDARRIHRFGRLLRIWESLRVMHGDCALLKLRGGQIQTIEHDRIRNPETTRNDIDQWVHGVKLDKWGGPLAYAIHKRSKYGSYEFERTVRAGNVIPFGYYHRADQTRGVSPLSSAINTFRDAYEGIDFTLARMKVSQLFGLAIYSEENEGKGLSLDFSAGPQVLEAGTEDKIEFLESNQPSSQLQQFFEVVIGIALKALDIPFSFYDESFTNFFGSKAALMQYLQSAGEKREDVKEVLRSITVWWLATDIADGTLDLPSGMSIPDIRFEWVPRGLPWWDMVRDAVAFQKMLDSKILTRSQIRREFFADDWELDVLPQIQREEQLLAGLNSTPAPNEAEVMT